MHASYGEDDPEIVDYGYFNECGDSRNFVCTQITPFVTPRGSVHFSASPGTFERRTVRPSVRFGVPYTVSDIVTPRRFVRPPTPFCTRDTVARVVTAMHSPSTVLTSALSAYVR